MLLRSKFETFRRVELKTQFKPIHIYLSSQKSEDLEMKREERIISVKICQDAFHFDCFLRSLEMMYLLS
jgi:hypothetical protein